MVKLIAYMATPGGLTGAPLRLITLANALRNSGVKVCVASQSGSQLLEMARANGHSTATLDATGVLTLQRRALFRGGIWFRFRVASALLQHNLRVFRCIRRNRGDVVWIRGSKGIAFAGLGALLSRRPLIWDVDFELPSKGMARWLHRFGLWASRRVVLQYDSAATAIFGQILSMRFQKKFLSIIPGIDLGGFDSYATRRSGKPHAMSDPFVILQVGTICDRKNQRFLIDALQHIDFKRLPVPLRVKFAGGVHDEEYFDSLKEQVKRLGLEDTVEFLGWRNDVYELMTQSDILVMPSKDEGVPNTVQEAMSIGLPVIVSEAGGMLEVVNNGLTGWVLTMDTSRVWAEQIEACISQEDRLAEISQKALLYATEHFGTTEWGNRYAEVIRETIANQA